MRIETRYLTVNISYVHTYAVQHAVVITRTNALTTTRPRTISIIHVILMVFKYPIACVNTSKIKIYLKYGELTTTHTQCRMIYI